MSDKVITFVAALGFPEGAQVSLEEVTEKFEVALKRTLQEHPAVIEYFVQTVHDLSEVHVGLKFRGVKRDLVEEWAEDIIKDTFDFFTKTGGVGRAANLKREDSSLVVA